MEVLLKFKFAEAFMYCISRLTFFWIYKFFVSLCRGLNTVECHVIMSLQIVTVAVIYCNIMCVTEVSRCRSISL